MQANAVRRSRRAFRKVARESPLPGMPFRTGCQSIMAIYAAHCGKYATVRGILDTLSDAYRTRGSDARLGYFSRIAAKRSRSRLSAHANALSGLGSPINVDAKFADFFAQGIAI